MSTGRHLYERYLDWSSDGLNPKVFDEALQLICALALAVIMNRLIFERRIACPPLNWLLTILALFVSMQIPFQELQLSRVARGWIFAICICGLVGLPHALSFYFWPTEGARRKISLLLYAVVLGLFIADFLRRSS